ARLHHADDAQFLRVLQSRARHLHRHALHVPRPGRRGRLAQAAARLRRQRSAVCRHRRGDFAKTQGSRFHHRPPPPAPGAGPPHERDRGVILPLPGGERVGVRGLGPPRKTPASEPPHPRFASLARPLPSGERWNQFLFRDASSPTKLKTTKAPPSPCSIRCSSARAAAHMPCPLAPVLHPTFAVGGSSSMAAETGSFARAGSVVSRIRANSRADRTAP